MSEEKVYFSNSKGQKLAGLLNVPEGEGPFNALVRAHGYGSSKDGSTGSAFAEEFSDAVVFRFDFHGHGESEGDFSEVDAYQCVDDLKNAIEYVKSLDVVDKIAVTGSSLGGLATTLAVAWHDNVVSAVMICPVSDFAPLRARDIKYQKLLEYDVYREAEKIDVPALIIHGDHDIVVPIKQSKELIKHLKKGKFHIIEGASHIFGEEAHFKEVISTAAKFIRENF